MPSAWRTLVACEEGCVATTLPLLAPPLLNSRTLNASPPWLAGFDAPWERLLFRGRELKGDASLAEQGVGSGATLTAVRHVLVADGWKVGGRQGGWAAVGLGWVGLGAEGLGW